MWKKECKHDYRRWKQVKERRNSGKNSECDVDEKLYPDAKLLGVSLKKNYCKVRTYFILTDCRCRFANACAGTQKLYMRIF